MGRRQLRGGMTVLLQPFSSGEEGELRVEERVLSQGGVDRRRVLNSADVRRDARTVCLTLLH